jgi:dolichyl-diphosphooligosaccharide--protein glycosyltransferase
MVSTGDVQDLLAERPDLELALEAILVPEEPWTFEDVDVDSGSFGELVGHNIVIRNGDKYRVANRTAVKEALRDDESSEATESPASGFDVDFSVTSLFDSRLEIALLVTALLFVIALRMISFPAVYRGGDIVLSSNDPYYYRYLVELLLADPSVTLSKLPGRVAHGEPLFVATMWLGATLLGGTAGATGHLLAWYPIVSAVVSALLCYAISVILTDDRRVGLAAVALLAVIPSHATRTSLGFADHHAFDYPWLGLTLLGLVLIAATTQTVTHRRNHTIIGALAIGAGVAGQILAWDNGALLIVPVGLAIAVDVIQARVQNRSPLESSGPVIAGLIGAAGVVWMVHSALGWHTTLVASTPALLATAGVAALVVGELAHRIDLSVVILGGVELLGLAAAILAMATIWPAYWTRLTDSVSQRLLAPRSIAEVRGVIEDPIVWFLLFGFILLLAAPYLVWGISKGRTDRRWLPVTIFGWYFLSLATIQARFAGELSTVVAVFAGIGFVHLAAWVDVTSPPVPFSDETVEYKWSRPEWKTVRAVGLLFVLVAGLSIVMVPLTTNLVTVPEGQYETASWATEYSDEQELSYPDNYVFSSWDSTRMYNYFVNGQARSYDYAQVHYSSFVTSTDARGWYTRLSKDNRAGFVVTTSEVVTNESAIGTRLHRNHGSAAGETPGVGHYQLLHTTADGEYKLFRVVPGAVITGNTTPNTTVLVSTEVAVQSTPFEYTRRATANETGAFRIRVAYPGTYTVGNTSVTVSEGEISGGQSVAVGRVAA